MWTRKDFTALGLAAVGSFGLTVATLLPRVVNATGEAAAAEVISPTLTVGDCTIQAKATGNADTAQKMALRTQFSPQAGQIFLSPDSEPSFTLVVKNNSAADQTLAFSASLDTSRPMGRVLGSQNQWNDTFSVVLKAGETKEIPVDPTVTRAAAQNQPQVSSKVTLGAGVLGTLTLRADGTAPIVALAFNVVRPVAPSAGNAAAPAAQNAIAQADTSAR